MSLMSPGRSLGEGLQASTRVVEEEKTNCGGDIAKVVFEFPVSSER